VTMSFKGLQEHPFTYIQLSDKEKFHTGMLKLLLDVFKSLEKEHGLWDVDSKDYSNFEYVLEKDSIDLYAKEGGEETIVESKFKSGLHLSKVRMASQTKIVSQLAKYVSKKPEAKNGVVVSLFPEREQDLDVKDWLPELSEESEIKEFKNIQFTETVHNRLVDLLSELESDKGSRGKIEPNGEGKIALLQLWKSYLKDLKELVDYFEGHQKDLRRIEQSNFGVTLKRIKLKGIFERQRMIQIQQKVYELIKDKERRLLELFEYESDHKAVGRIGNTHGNAQLHLAIPPNIKNNNLKDFGLQWQNNSLKFFIERKNGNTKDDFQYSREKALKKWGKKLKQVVDPQADIKNPSSGKLASVSIMKPEVFGSIESFPATLVLGLKFLLENREEIVKELNV
jgi:hypothetical protein